MDAKTRSKQNFEGYKDVVLEIVKKYIPKNRFEEGMDEIMNYKNRIMVEVEIVSKYPNKV